MSKTYASASEYFLNIANQDLQHLQEQPNSIDDREDARRKFIHTELFRRMIPDFTRKDLDHGPFKLICDDFSFANILVNNAQELKIVAVLDWEWTYAAPAQMLFSPRWLLIKKPFNWDAADITRYEGLSEKFASMLEEEELRRSEVVQTGARIPSLADMMRATLRDGTFWFHELVYSCFESPDTPAWTSLRALYPHLLQRGAAVDDEVDAFVEAKMSELERYNVEWVGMKAEIDRKEADFQALRARVEADELRDDAV